MSSNELKKLRKEIKQREKEVWTWWENKDDPAMNFIRCSCDVIKKYNPGRPTRNFDEMPDFFWSKAITELYFDARKSLAAENMEAAKRLHYIATFAVKALNDAAYQAPQYFRPIAESDFLWPGFLGKHPDTEKHQKSDLFAKLHLGKKSSIRVEGKKFSLETLETRIAFQLWGRIEFVRRNENTLLPIDWSVLESIKADAMKLPPLSRETYQQWWKVGEKLFLNFYGEKFENVENFAHYWLNAAYKDDPKARALIRRDIKKRLQQGFRSIAVKSSAV